MAIRHEEIDIKGKTTTVDAVIIGNKTIVIQGKFIKTARIKDEWWEDIGNPKLVIDEFKTIKIKPDLFTFWQRLPEIKPKFNYFMEKEAISVLPIDTFENWWNSQIRSPTRNRIKKAERRGIVTKFVSFNDGLVKGIMNIFNETPVRRGKPFWHYGKDFNTVKKEWSRDLDKSDFIGAYYKDNLIGFIKMVYAENFAAVVQNLSMMKHRKKYTNNALMAKAVELCTKQQIPYITYGGWRRGSHADFLSRNGFEKILMPRYYVPLTFKGRIILKLKLHKGIKEILPKSITAVLYNLRTKYYLIKFKKT